MLATRARPPSLGSVVVDGYESALMIRQANGNAVRGRSPRRVYFRNGEVVVRMNVLGASGFVAA